ncbi:hypothetical protein SDC9_41129 [bioreactor metagenome]|uniref:4Fe-4S ferredoxin-type domain-containing protein n=1 Tax=bioreactor metagenome TaxID=1076179 RepID=A0A644VUE1_9ZZZZ
MTTIIETTVKNGFCCGCGVCAGVCPSQNLAMDWNIYGEYNPVRLQDCKHECGLCVTVCPFADGNPNEDDLGKLLYGNIPQIHHRSETGYFLSIRAGAVINDAMRLRSASGGLATWFLDELLRRDIVDAVICVHHYDEPRKLFKFVVARSIDAIHEGAGSVYYPVEISEVLQYIRHNPGRYAIIGLPCLLKGLRLAQTKSVVLRERIVMMVGLACANQKSTYFTRYAAWKAGIPDGELAGISYRKKNPENSLARFFTFQFRNSMGKVITQKWDDEIGLMYHNRFCTIHSCDCCDDMFAECADVCFMDAWLPEYICEPRGTSVWIARSMMANELLIEGVAQGLICDREVNFEEMLAGQSSMRWKRELLGYRLTLMHNAGETVPTKRVVPTEGKILSKLEKARCKAAFEIQRDGKKIFVTSGYAEVGVWFSSVWNNVSWYVKLGRRVGKYYGMCVTLGKYFVSKWKN